MELGLEGDAVYRPVEQYRRDNAGESEACHEGHPVLMWMLALSGKERTVPVEGYKLKKSILSKLTR